MNETVPAYLRHLMESGGDAPHELPPATPYTPPRAELVEIPRPIPVDRLDQDAVRIVRRLTENGFTAYLVGGAVRDLLFGLKPKDFDIVTSATPRDMRKLFRNCRIIGRRFRLAHVFFRDKIIEVATFRANAGAAAEIEASEEAQNDVVAAALVEGDALAMAENTVELVETPAPRGRGGRVPESGLIIRDDNVFGTPEEDAVRRDFTFNALFYDIDRQMILDYVGGVEDVEKRQVRTIGDPRIRMREDPIRMLRAIRLAARMGCTIEPATWDAIRTFRHEILHAAAPRISEDILRMFRGGAIAPAMDMMIVSGVLEVILPELHHHLAQHLATAGPEEVEALRSTLRVADAKTQAGQALTAPVQFALLVAPPLMAARPTDDHGSVKAATTEDLADAMRPIGMRLAISKRDSERMRQIFFTLPKLLPPLPGKKRRASGPMLRRAFLPETVDFFEVMALSTGELVDEAARWRRKIAELPVAAPETKPAAARRPRRRRPGGERRGRGGDTPTPPDLPVQPAD